MSRQKHYLITGITGFAGPHLANLLHKEGHKVSGLVRGSNGMETDILDVVGRECFDSINFLYGNLEDADAMNRLMDEYFFDGIFHLAAQSHPPTSLKQPLDTFRTNIMGSANLIDAVEKYSNSSCKVMFCSTSEVYGNSGKDGRLLLESDLLTPSNPYAVSKAAIDLYMQERMTNGKISGFITRAFSHTGPRRGKNFSISSDAWQLARIMALEQPAVLRVGNLDTVRVVLDVRDVVRAYYMLMENEESNGQVYNVCGDTPYKMGHYTDLLEDATGLKEAFGPIERRIDEKLFRPIDIAYQHGDTTKLKDLTGWKPEIPLQTTMEDLLQYWVDKINAGKKAGKK